MKRIICFLLCVVLTLTGAGSVCADSTEETAPVYGYLPVASKEADGEVEHLFVMCVNGCVYALGEDLAERLGYTFHSGSKTSVSLHNEAENDLATGYFLIDLNSTEVKRDYATRLAPLESYSMPQPSIQNEVGIWLPLEYTVNLTGGELLVVGDRAVITPAYRNMEWVIQQAAKKGTYYQFDFGDDFGYTDESIEKLADASGVVNLFSGCLSLDGTSWVAMTQKLWGSSSAMDAKYGKTLALLMCGSSSGEVEQAAQVFSDIGDTLATDGLVADLLKRVEKKNLSDIQEKLTEVNKIIQEKSLSEAGNSKTWQQLQRSVGFLNANESVQKFLKENSHISDTMSGISELIKLGGYLSEFYTQDAYSVKAFSEYLGRSGQEDWMPDATHTAMRLTADTFLEDPLLYSASHLLLDQLEGALQDGVKTVLGMPANLALISWNIGSNTIPWLKEGLEDTDQFQLAMYATILQADAYLTYKDCLGKSWEKDVTAKGMEEAGRACYVYLKSCYVAREAAIAALEGGKENKDVRAVLKKQKAINKELAELLAILKLSGMEESGGYPYGFLPEDSEAYLKTANDEDIGAIILREPYYSYQQTVQKMQDRHGKAKILYGSYGMDSLGGVSYVQTVDFDKNGLEELIVAYKTDDDPYYFEWKAEIYTYDPAERSAKRIFKGDTAFGGGVGGNYIFLAENQDGVCFVSGHTVGYGLDYSYYTFRDGDFTEVRHIGYRDDGYNYVYLIDGQDTRESDFWIEEGKWQKHCTIFHFAQNISKDTVEEVRKSIERLEEKICPCAQPTE